MKKIVAFAFFLSFFLGESIAQGDIRFGLQVSPGISWLSAEDRTINNNSSNIPSLKLGLLGEYYFRENYAFFAGLGFAFNHGGTLRYENEGRYWPNSDFPNTGNISGEDVFPAGVNLQYQVQYVEIPFGLKLKTKEFGYLQYFAEIPTFSIGIRTNAKGQIEGDDINPDAEDGSHIIKEEVNPFTLAWGAGAGVEYNISSSTAIVAGLFYRRVFTDMLKDNESTDAKVVLNNITIRLAVMF